MNLMLLSDLINSIEARHLHTGIKLHPPVSISDIPQFESKLGFKLPADFREFYTLCNGFACEEDLFSFLSIDDALCRDEDHGKDWIIFAEYMIYSDYWSLRKLEGDRYEIFYNDGQEIVLTNSLAVFLERLAQGHIFDEGGLYAWRDEIKKKLI